MLDERDCSIRFPFLLIPTKAKAMSIQPCYYIIQLIAIDVVHSHHAATNARSPVAIPGKGFGMISPRFAQTIGYRLLPPAIWINQIQAAIAIDVTNANAMCQ